MHLTDGEITTSVLDKDGEGGKINITPEFIVLEDSYIKADAFEGQAGKVSITATGVYNNANGLYKYPQDEEFISALSQFGLDGIVEINTPDIDITTGLFPLSTNFSKSPALKEGCTPRALKNTLLTKSAHRVTFNHLPNTTLFGFYPDETKKNPDQKTLSPAKLLFGCHYSG